MKESDIRKQEVFDEYLKIIAEDVERIFIFDRFIAVPCPACGSEQCREAFVKTGFHYVSCERCGTLFVNPRPVAEMLDKFYVDSRSERFWVDKFFAPVAEARRVKIFAPRAAYVAERFGSLEGKKVGDIGAGFGLFLEELQKVCPAADCLAIEPSGEMADICRGKGIESIPVFFEQIGPEYEQAFDLLTLFELFEHLLDPAAFLKKAWSALRPGGTLLLTTLNGEGFDILVLWEKAKCIFPPVHLNFFNPDSISILLRSTGFEIKEISTPGQLDWNILEERYFRERTDIGRFWALFADKGSDEAKKELQQWISRHGFSSHMRIVARKPGPVDG